MTERRIAARQRSFLQGRIFYNNRRSSVDCLVRDVSETGAKLVFPGAVTLPDIVEIYLSNKEEVRRAKVQWRRGNEMGVGFGFDEGGNQDAAASTDVFGRVLKLESDYAALRKTVSELRAEVRKMRSEPVE